ncbi:unnamed protein product, partial [Mesorhabditis belari]
TAQYQLGEWNREPENVSISFSLEFHSKEKCRSFRLSVTIWISAPRKPISTNLGITCTRS